MKIFVLISCFLILPSCSGISNIFNNWFNQKKEGVITQLASKSTEDNLPEDQKTDLLYLYNEIKTATKPICRNIQFYIENNETLIIFEKGLNLPKGFLFDGLIGYDYEKAFFNTSKSDIEKVVFSVVSVWKREISLQEIKEVIQKINKCYPPEYVDRDNTTHFTEDNFLKFFFQPNKFVDS